MRKGFGRRLRARLRPRVTARRSRPASLNANVQLGYVLAVGRAKSEGHVEDGERGSTRARRERRGRRALLPLDVPRYALRDNRAYGTVGEFLRDEIAPESALSVVSAFFTMYANDALRRQLDGIASMRFLLGQPEFVQHIDPERDDKKAFKFEGERLALKGAPLRQKDAAKRCAEFFGRVSVDIRRVAVATASHFE